MVILLSHHPVFIQALTSLFIYSVITNCFQYNEQTLEPNYGSVSIAQLRFNWIFVYL